MDIADPRVRSTRSSDAAGSGLPLSRRRHSPGSVGSGRNVGGGGCDAISRRPHRSVHGANEHSGDEPGVVRRRSQLGRCSQTRNSRSCIPCHTLRSPKRQLHCTGRSWCAHGPRSWFRPKHLAGAVLESCGRSAIICDSRPCGPRGPRGRSHCHHTLASRAVLDGHADGGGRFDSECRLFL